MKHLTILALLATVLTGCNAMTTTADKVMNKKSSFSQDPRTTYPTVNGQKDGEPAPFAKETFGQTSQAAHNYSK